MNSKNIEEEFYRTHNVFHKLEKKPLDEESDKQLTNQNYLVIINYFII